MVFSLGRIGVRKTSLLPGTRAMYRTSGSLALIDELRGSIGGFDARSVTAASELARNTLEHGGGGELEIAAVENGIRKGIRLTFSDNGPGIADIKQALTDGFTTGQGMGLGLGGSKRLMNEFQIRSQAGSGTSVTAIRWK